MRRGILILSFLLLTALNLWSVPPYYTNNFVNYTGQNTYTTVVENGNLRIGYPDIWSYNTSWQNRWGNMVIKGSDIYVVWADNRLQGFYRVFMQKIDATTGSPTWSSNFHVFDEFVPGEETNQTYMPSMAIYDKAHIYVAFRRVYAGVNQLFAAMIDDTGASPAIVWYKQIQNNITYRQIATTVDAKGNFYILGNRSDNREYLFKINSLGNVVSLPVAGYANGINSTINMYPNEIEYMKGQLYYAAEMSTAGNYAARVNTNNSPAPTWGNFLATAKNYYSTTYPNQIYNDIAVDTNNNLLYFAYSRRPDIGTTTLDVFLSKVATNGTFGWGVNKDVVVLTIAGQQTDPQVGLDSNDNPWVLWIDNNQADSLFIKMCDKGGTFSMLPYELDATAKIGGLNNVVYHPVMKLIGNKMYVAFLMQTTYGSAVSNQLRVLCYTLDMAYSLAPAMAWRNLNVQKASFKTKATMTTVNSLTFTPAMGSLKYFKLQAKYNANGQTINMKLSTNNGTTYWVAQTNVTYGSPNGLSQYAPMLFVEMLGDGVNDVTMDWFAFSASACTMGNLLYYTNATIFGAATRNRTTPSAQTITSVLWGDGISSNVTYLILSNEGTTNTAFGLAGTVGDSRWGVEYFLGTSNISEVMQSVYLTNIPAGKSVRLKVVTKPSKLTYDGEVMDNLLFLVTDGLTTTHDTMTIRTIAKKYKTDIAVISNGNIRTLNYTELVPTTQKAFSFANARFNNYGEWVTNILLVSNSGYGYETVELSNWSVGTAANWEVKFADLTAGIDLDDVKPLVSLDMDEVHQVAVMVRPKGSTLLNEPFSVGLYARVTNGFAYTNTPRHDSAMFNYKAIKVQPDAIYSRSEDFVGAVGGNNYTYTNTLAIVQQSITQRTVSGKTVYVYIKVENDGLMTDIIKISANTITNAGWTANYISSSSNINAALYGAGYWLKLAPGASSPIISCDYQPNLSVPSGDTPVIKLMVVSSNKPAVNDYITIFPRAFKVAPDLQISKTFTGSYTNDNNVGAPLEYALTPTNLKGQLLFNKVEQLRSVTNYFLVQNDSSDPDNIYVRGTASDTHWTIRYYETNSGVWIEKTSSISGTNGYLISLTAGVTRKFRVVISPNSDATADEIKNVMVKCWSDNVVNQCDHGVFSNKNIQVKPRVAVNGEDDGNCFTASYAAGASSTYQKGGQVLRYPLMLMNDGGSVESYRLKVAATTSGGGVPSDWKYRIVEVVGAVSNDRTAAVMGAGYAASFTSNATKNYFIEVQTTNYAWLNPASDRGGVSNRIVFDVDFTSETSPTRGDKARLDTRISRGVPDVMIGSLFSRNQFYGGYVAGNQTTLGIVLNYPNKFMTTVFNNNDPNYHALDADDFILKANVSNAVGIYGNWSWKFYDKDNVDITAAITGAGFTISSLNAGDEVPVYFWASNSAGIVKDKLAIRYELSSKTRAVMKDYVWNYVEVVAGFPELLVSTNGSLYRGIGQFSADSYYDEQVLTGKTNHYVVLLSNTAPLYGFPAFILKEDMALTSGFNVIYKTNGITIPRAVLQTAAYTNKIYNKLSASTPKFIKLDVYVSPNGATPGQYSQFKLIMYLSSNENVYDEIRLKDTVVKPRVNVYYPGSTQTLYKAYFKPGESFFKEIRVANLDVVNGSYKLTANTGSGNIGFTYYRIAGSVSNAITGTMTGAGWVTNIGPSQYVQMGITASIGAGALSGERYNARMYARSQKVTATNDYVDFTVEAVNAKPDAALWVNGVKNFDNQYIPLTEQTITDKIVYQSEKTYTIKIDNDLVGGSNVQYIFDTPSVLDMASDYTVKYLVGSVPITLPYSNLSLRAGQTTNVTLKISNKTMNASGSVGSISMRVRAARVSGLEDMMTLFIKKVNPDIAVLDDNNRTRVTNYIQPGYSAFVQCHIENRDSVSEQYVVKGTVSNGSITVKYYKSSDTNNPANDITTTIQSGYSITVPGSDRKQIYMAIKASSSAVSGDRLNNTITATCTAFTNKKAILYSLAEVKDCLPDISLYPYSSSTNIGQGKYLTNQTYKEYVSQITNKFLLRAENDISVGSMVRFDLREASKISAGAYSIKYQLIKNGSTNYISLTNLRLNLSAGQKTNVIIEVVLTNTNLAVASEAYLNYELLSLDVPSAYDKILLTLRKIKPNISFQFQESTTNKIVYITNINSISFPIQFANLDQGIDEKIKIQMVKPSGEWKRRFNFTIEYATPSGRVDITAQITNNGWTSPALDPLLVKNIWINLNPYFGASDSDFIKMALTAYPMHNTNLVKKTYYEVYLVNSIVDASIQGGNLAMEIGDQEYLPTKIVATDRIEAGETNIYKLYLQNDNNISGQAIPIKVISSFSNDYSGFNYAFYDAGGNPININTYIANLNYESRTNVLLKVTPKAGLVSGKKMHLTFNIRVTNAQVFQDTIELVLYKDAPKPQLKVAGPLDRTWKIDSYKDVGQSFYSYKGAPLNFYLAIINNDAVWDDFYLKSDVLITNDMATNWTVNFLAYSNQLVSLPVASNGIYLSNYTAGEYFQIRVSLVPKETASPDMIMTVISTLKSMKNPAIQSVMTNVIRVATGYINGMVSDKKNGTPLTGVLVTVKDNYGSTSKIFTESDGRYNVKVYPLINSMFEVKADLKDYIGLSTNFIFKATTNTVNFQMVGMNIETPVTYIRSFPNPTTVGSGATFVYNVENDGSVIRIELYDMNGKLVQKLVNGTLNRGANYVKWEGSDTTGKVVQRGVYLLFIKEGDKAPVIKKVFVK